MQKSSRNFCHVYDVWPDVGCTIKSSMTKIWKSKKSCIFNASLKITRSIAKSLLWTGGQPAFAFLVNFCVQTFVSIGFSYLWCHFWCFECQPSLQPAPIHTSVFLVMKCFRFHAWKAWKAWKADLGHWLWLTNIAIRIKWIRGYHILWINAMWRR